MYSVPLLIRLGRNCITVKYRDTTYKYSVLLLTFFAYLSYHQSRKPISVVKGVLHQNCTVYAKQHHVIITSHNQTFCDWAPFDHNDWSSLLGTLDVSYLFAYAVAMFISGQVAERMDLRVFLSLGMILSGLTTALFGLGYYLNIHNLAFFIGVQLIGGFVQASGWPAVVACVGNWFGKGKRGFIMGVWNSHTSVGNIVGSVIAARFVNTQWGLSFIVPGAIIFTGGCLMYVLLCPYPEDVGCTPPDHEGVKTSDESSYVRVSRTTSAATTPSASMSASLNNTAENMYKPPSAQSVTRALYDDSPVVPADDVIIREGRDSDEETDFSVTASLLATSSSSAALSSGSHASLPPPRHREKAITLFQALRIPGVVEFSFCLFFAKLVSYTFLYWLPKYIKQSSAGISAEHAADMSTAFDFGGIAGGISAGLLNDNFGKPALTCLAMLGFAAPMMFVYQIYGAISYFVSIVLLLIMGFFVNGPYALITTAVSANLGTHRSIRGSSKALATVTAIIDGTGSIGAACGPLLTGLIVTYGSWQNVFFMLIAANVAAMILLGRLVFYEFCEIIERRKMRRSLVDDAGLMDEDHLPQEEDLLRDLLNCRANESSSVENRSQDIEGGVIP